MADDTGRTVLAQPDVEATTNEIARFRPLLEGLDLADTDGHADALRTQRGHADWLVTAKHATYLLMVKANQPACTTSCDACLGRHPCPRPTPATAATAGPRSAGG